MRVLRLLEGYANGSRRSKDTEANERRVSLGENMAFKPHEMLLKQRQSSIIRRVL
jgi:hypothetical protein